ncbi:hypothetical protein HBB16_10125 [Pseudonocardia sp. MCCB 268]|nr:hypothetical protein [Pseudonocardia cytotoxica]
MTAGPRGERPRHQHLRAVGSQPDAALQLIGVFDAVPARLAGAAVRPGEPGGCSWYAICSSPPRRPASPTAVRWPAARVQT